MDPNLCSCVTDQTETQEVSLAIHKDYIGHISKFYAKTLRVLREHCFTLTVKHLVLVTHPECTSNHDTPVEHRMHSTMKAVNKKSAIQPRDFPQSCSCLPKFKTPPTLELVELQLQAMGGMIYYPSMHTPKGVEIRKRSSFDRHIIQHPLSVRLNLVFKRLEKAKTSCAVYTSTSTSY